MRSVGIYRESTWYAQRQDEFTAEAGLFGIEVPSTYGCISGCAACREFRNAVRSAREVYDVQWAAQFSSLSPSDFEYFTVPLDVECDGTCIDRPLPAKTTDERIADALELIAARLSD